MNQVMLILGLLLTGDCHAQRPGLSDSNGVREVPLRTHSLSVPFLDQDFHSRWWDYGGTTVVNTAKHVRLTYDRQHSTGYLWSRLPITATNYEIEWTFKISGRGNSLYGDGMAMWLTQGRAKLGPAMGNEDRFDGLGIFFDTYRNGRRDVGFPYVTAMLGDGNTVYDKGQDNQNTELAGCSARGLREASFPTKARLTYYKNDFLKLELQYKVENEWEECFTVDDVNIPNVVYLGFTAVTGEISDNHDLIEVHSKNIFVPDAGSPGAKMGKSGRSGDRRLSSSHATSSSLAGGVLSFAISWLWTLLKIAIFVGVSYGAFRGYQRYKSKPNRQVLGF
ncbi:hypothetical protein PYCC9005_001895 [Savitreella phatthalungensis]